MTSPKHIIVARTDKIGDLLLSLPVFQTLRESFPSARITAFVNPATREIVQGHPAVDAVELWNKNEGVFRLAERLKGMNADVFISLYPRPRQILAAWLAGIPVRVGTAYRWYGFFLNRRIKVHRSVCDRHEVEYNLDLLKPLGVEKFAKKIQFPLSSGDRDFARDLLGEKGIGGTPYLVIHPGHKGSALNWSVEKYAETAARLCQRTDLRVVLTAGETETELIGRLTVLLPPLPASQKPVLLIGECTLRQLAAVYEGAKCFISASTGPMHLAAAVGTPTVSLFCPIPETSPVRWGPWGNDSTVLMPKNLKCSNCAVGYCSKHDPMDAISVAEVLQAVEKYIQKSEK